MRIFEKQIWAVALDLFPKTFEIQAILAIFEPFEVLPFGKHLDRIDGENTRHFLANSADRPRICANPNQSRANPGTIGVIRPKVACRFFKLQTA